MSNEQKKSTQNGEKKNVKRSPMYPYITFQDALSKARLIYNHEKRNSTTAQVLYNHLGYQKKTGSSGRVLAALKQYGFLEENAGKYKVTEVAWRLFHLPENSPEKRQLEKDLAMKPRLFREIVARYPDGLPSEPSLKSYLILEKEFNENTTELFIKVLRAAFDVAKPFDSEYDFPDDSYEDEDENHSENGEMKSSVSNDSTLRENTPSRASQAESSYSASPQQHKEEADYVFSFQLSFPRKIRAEVRIYGQNLLKQDITTLSDEVSDLAKAFDDNVILKRAGIWHNKDFDVPVVIIGEPEKAEDGREYISIEGSQSRIPYNEVEVTEQ